MTDGTLVVSLEVIHAAHIQPTGGKALFVADLFRDFFDELINFERLCVLRGGKAQVAVLEQLLA